MEILLFYTNMIQRHSLNIIAKTCFKSALMVSLQSPTSARQTPEGLYHITRVQIRPNSNSHQIREVEPQTQITMYPSFRFLKSTQTPSIWYPSKCVSFYASIAVKMGKLKITFRQAHSKSDRMKCVYSASMAQLRLTFKI